MSKVEIIEKNVTPTCCWANIDIDFSEYENIFAYKVTFDRAYPYFWIWGDSLGYDTLGIALTLDDVNRAVTAYDDNDEPEEADMLKFDLSVDGIMPCELSRAHCVAVGSRKTIYLLVNVTSEDRHGCLHVHFSAQEDAICPIMMR